jgi:predicted transcriptional regulator
MPKDMKAGELLPLVTQIVAAKLSNGKTPSSEVVALIQSVYQVFSELRTHGTSAELPEPAVPIKRSVTPDYIVCLEDGRKLKMLKRHLRGVYDLTPDQYRRRWGIAGGLSDGRTELLEEAQPACEAYRAWYATASEAREVVGRTHHSAEAAMAIAEDCRGWQARGRAGFAGIRWQCWRRRTARKRFHVHPVPQKNSKSFGIIAKGMITQRPKLCSRYHARQAVLGLLKHS